MPDGHSRPRTIGLGNARGHLSRTDLAIPSPPPFTAQSEGHGSAKRSANGLSGQAGAIIVRAISLLDPVSFEPSD